MQTRTQTIVRATTNKQSFPNPSPWHSFLQIKNRNTDRPVFVTTYNPSLPNLNNVIKKYYPILTATERCQEAFKDIPLLAYRRPKNLRDFLVKAKLKQSPPNNSNLPKKVKRCNDGRCRTYKFIANGHHPILSTIRVNKEKSYNICPALPIILFV